jgi:RimJ/RimL family protein N-acetyltransferase
LRNLSPEDVTQAYIDWMNDPEVVQFTESRFSSHSFDSISKYVEACNQDPDVFLFGIFDKETDLHIGNIKLGPINHKHSLGDIGIIIGRKEFWGKGMATEAICLMSNFAFAEVILHKLTAGCYSTNLGSARAFEKAGFILEGIRSKHMKRNNIWENLLEYGKIISSDT